MTSGARRGVTIVDAKILRKLHQGYRILMYRRRQHSHRCGNNDILGLRLCVPLIHLETDPELLSALGEEDI
jgi:hypothetical protein